jgi:hypothetical protein
MRKGLILGLVLLSGGLAHSQSRVVVVWDTNAVHGSTIDSLVVRSMMDAGIKALTDSTTLGGAWKSCFPGLTATQNIALKLTVWSLASMPAHPPVTRAILRGLTQMQLGTATFRPWRLIAFDRWNREFSGAGYAVRTDTFDMRCGGNDSTWGYQVKSYSIFGTAERFSGALADSSAFMINLSVLKDMSVSTINFSLSMKNHYGTINYPSGLHSSSIMHRQVPEVMRVIRDSLGHKEKIYIIDGLFAIYNSPSSSPQAIPRTIILSKDPVAIDSFGVEMLNNMRVAHGYTPKNSPYLAYAESIGLGTRRYTLIRINNPSAVELEPAPEGMLYDFALFPPRPNPFTGTSEIPFLLPRAGEARVEVFNALGVRVRTLTRGTRTAGQHTVTWDGRDGSGHKVASGVYLVRLAFGGASIERSLSLIR